MPISFTLAHALPELVLAGGALLLVLYGALRGRESDGLATEIAVGILGIAILVVLLGAKQDATLFGGAFANDGFARMMKVLALGASLVTLLMSEAFLRREGIDKFEFPILVLLSSLGMAMLVSANDLIALYLGLELMSLALYVLAAFHRDDVRSTEAGLKYFVLGALSSGMLLYGASLLYGFAGTVSFAGIASAIHGQASLGVVFGLVFVFAGLAFKVSAVPFHMWTPDVYEGAPTPVTAFFSAGPKIAAMAVFTRLTMTAFPGIVSEWRQIIVFIALASMALGAFAAIGQTNIKRLMAYSSIGHMGFALVGLAAGSEAGVKGVVAYMAIYMVMTLGTFAGILLMKRDGRQVETIADLAGLARHDRSMAFFMAMLMFSLAGVPPLAGFFAKWYVFAAAVEAGLYGLAVAGVVLSAIAAFYYLRIVKIVYFDEPARPFDAASRGPGLVLVGCALLIVAFAIVPGPLDRATSSAARSLIPGAKAARL